MLRLGIVLVIRSPDILSDFLLRIDDNRLTVYYLGRIAAYVPLVSIILIIGIILVDIGQSAILILILVFNIK